VGNSVSKRKVFFRVGLAITAVFVLALVLIPILVPAERWQQIAFDRLEAETGLVASAESAGVSLLPLGLRLSGLELRDPENRPEWSGLELELEEVVVRARLKPLFSGRFEAEQVTLKRPRIVLTPPAGSTDDAVGEPGASAPEAAATVSIALAAIAIEDGYVELNQPDGSRIILHGLTNLSSLLIEGATGEATAIGSLDSVVVAAPDVPAETVRALSWKLDADFAADGSRGSVDLEKLALVGVNLAGEVGWETNDLTSVDARLDVEADLAALALEWFEPRRDEIEWPEGINPADFGDFTGQFTGELRWAGEIDPDSPPEAMADLLHVEGSLKNVGGRLLDRADLARVDADLAFGSGILRLDPLSIATPAGEFTGSYTARPLEASDARLDLAGSLDVAAARQLAIDLWPRLLPMMEEGAAPPDEWPQAGGQVALELGVDLPADADVEPQITWKASTAAIQVRPPDIDADFEISGVRLAGDAKNISWLEGKVTGPGVELTPRLDINLGDDITMITGKVEAGILDLDELQSRMVPAPETAMANWFVGVARAAGEPEMWTPPPELAAEVQLSAREVRTTGHRIEQVSADVSLAGQQIDVRDIRASLGSGRISGAAALDYTQNPPRWTTELSAVDIPASVLLAPDAPKLASALNTTLSGQINFDGSVTPNPEDAMKMLSGQLQLGAGAGSLQTEPVIGNQISSFVGQYAPAWQQLAFSSLDAELRVEAGLVHFDRFLLSGDTKVRAGGTVSLEGRCDYRLDIVLPASATPDVGSLQPVVEFLRDDDGTFPFAVRVTGPARKPKVQIDFDALQSRAEERGREEIGDAVEDAVKGLWDKLKGKN
jgi:hypothetical protein